MTPVALRNAIIAAVKNTAVVEEASADTWQAVETIDDLEGSPSRAFAVRPMEGPDKFTEHSGFTWRLSFELEVAYKTHPGSLDRMLADAKALDATLRGLPGTDAEINVVEVEPSRSEPRDPLMVHIRPFAVQYDDAS